jgi:hypothetical protein
MSSANRCIHKINVFLHHYRIFLRIDCIRPGFTGTSLTGVGTTCLLMDFNGDLGEVVSMWGDTLLRLVEDGRLFTIDRSSMGGSSDCRIAVKNNAAIMIVLSSYVRTIGVGVMTLFPGRLRHQGAFVSNSTIKVIQIGQSGLLRLKLHIY